MRLLYKTTFEIFIINPINTYIAKTVQPNVLISDYVKNYMYLTLIYYCGITRADLSYISVMDLKFSKTLVVPIAR